MTPLQKKATFQAVAFFVAQTPFQLQIRESSTAKLFHTVDFQIIHFASHRSKIPADHTSMF